MEGEEGKTGETWIDRWMDGWMDNTFAQAILREERFCGVHDSDLGLGKQLSICGWRGVYHMLNHTVT
jgi:hypothetical protein